MLYANACAVEVLASVYRGHPVVASSPTVDDEGNAAGADPSRVSARVVRRLLPRGTLVREIL